jgi:hypothetical protein
VASTLWLGQATPGWAAPSLESAVKAAYLLKFAPFVEWPPRAFASPTSPFSICVVGPDPFGAALDQAVAGQKVGDRPVVVRRLASTAGASDCQVLYAGRAPERPLAEVLQTLHSQPVLTVAEEGQHAQGCVIRFVLQDGRVRFAIDEAAAQAAGLGISSKLLSLAANNRR